MNVFKDVCCKLVLCGKGISHKNKSSSPTLYTKSDLLAEENAGLDTMTLGADGATPLPVWRVTLGFDIGGEGRLAPANKEPDNLVH